MIYFRLVQYLKHCAEHCSWCSLTHQSPTSLVLDPIKPLVSWMPSMQMLKFSSSATRISTLTAVYTYYKEKYCGHDALDNSQTLLLVNEVPSLNLVYMLTMVKMASYRECQYCLHLYVPSFAKNTQVRLQIPSEGTPVQTCNRSPSF